MSPRFYSPSSRRCRPASAGRERGRFQRPCGIGARYRSPRGARPAGVPSSSKGRFRGERSAGRGRDQAACRSTPGAVARRPAGPARPRAQSTLRARPQRSRKGQTVDGRGSRVRLLPEPVSDLGERDVGLGRDEAQDEGFVQLELRLARMPGQPGTTLSVLRRSRCHPPPSRPRPRGASPPHDGTAVDRLHSPRAQIELRMTSHGSASRVTIARQMRPALALRCCLGTKSPCVGGPAQKDYPDRGGFAGRRSLGRSRPMGRTLFRGQPERGRGSGRGSSC